MDPVAGLYEPRSPLGVLSAPQREACTLYFVQGLDQADIAEMLGISQPAVSQRISGANRALAEAGFPVLRRPKPDSSSRRVRQLGERLTATL